MKSWNSLLLSLSFRRSSHFAFHSTTISCNQRKRGEKKDCKCRSRAKRYCHHSYDTFNKLKIEIEQISCSLIFSRLLLLPYTIVASFFFPFFLISHEPTKWKKHFSSFLVLLLPVQNLERKEKHQATQLEQLTKKQIFLKWRCEQLISYNEALSKRRSVSECSTSTISSTNSYELTRSSSSICESGACWQLCYLFSVCFRMSILRELKEGRVGKMDTRVNFIEKKGCDEKNWRVFYFENIVRKMFLPQKNKL